MGLWALRATWVVLPFAAGAAADDAFAPWDAPPRVTASVLLWLAWGIGLVAVLVPRPAGLTVQRLVAPAFALASLVIAGGGWASDLHTWLAVALCLAASVATANPAFAAACAQGAAYGDERRFPLAMPPGLFLGPLPIARVLTAAAIAAPPLLLADGRIVLGVASAVAGGAVAFRLARSLHALSRRWIVLVPAGIVVADPMTLADPVLFSRRHVRSVAPAGATVAHSDTVDLRLGALYGSVALTLDEPADLLRASRSGLAAHVRARTLLVATAQRAALLDAVSQRRTAGAPG